MCLITLLLLLPCGLPQVFSHNPQVLEALRVLWHVPLLLLGFPLRKLLALVFVLELWAWVEVVAGIVVGMKMEVVEVGKFVEVEVGKFEKVVMEFVGFV